jgi:hypothetical protein
LTKRKLSKPKNKIATKDVEVDLVHWANSVVVYDQCLYGFPIMDMFPDVPLGHGIRLRVTAEVLDEGIPCPVRNNSKDREVTCTKPPEKKRKARKVIRRTK